MNNDNIKEKLMKNLPSIIHVLVVEDTNSRQTIVLEEANYSLGRDPRNSIVVASKKISRFHATLLRRTNASQNTFSYWILDGDLQGNRSRNGIFINQKRCLVQELKNNDIIQFGLEIKIKYYQLSEVSQLKRLKLKDYNNEVNKQKKPDRLPQTVARQTEAKSNPSTLIISEPNVDYKDIKSPALSKLASFPELSPHPIIEIDWEGNITYLNPAANYKFKELQRAGSNHPLLVDLIKNAKHHGTQNKLFLREVKIGNQVFEQYIHYLADKKVIRNYIFDFTKRKQLEEQIKESEQRYRTVINQTKEGIFLIDVKDKKILEANNAFTDLLGYNLEEIYTLNLYDLLADDNLIIDEEINALLDNQKITIKELGFSKKNKSTIVLETNISVLKYGDQNICCFTVSKKQPLTNKETLIQQDDLYDLLTGLPNRNLFLAQLNTAIANNKRNPQLLCIIYLELEHLSEEKNMAMELIQSHLLEGFGKRLRSSLRSGDTVARWADNQFVALLPQVRSLKDIAKISIRILDTLKPPFFINQNKIYIKTNIGIAIYNQDGNTLNELLENAHKALTISQEKKYSNYQFYNTTNNQEIERLLRLEKLLYHALEREEFNIYYQPQVNIKKKEITGITTILRWQHHELGNVSSEQFIPLAEETGLIVSMGEWLLRTACHQYQLWQNNDLKDFPIIINLSLQQFQQPNIIAFIRSILTENNLKSDLLELQITEATILKDFPLASAIIKELNEIGVRICLNDFGSGICGLGYFKQFQIHSLKIANSMIKNLVNNEQDLTIFKTLINLSETFNFRVIAEGIETQKELQLISNLGCEEIEGKLFTEPLNKDDASNFLGNPILNF